MGYSLQLFLHDYGVWPAIVIALLVNLGLFAFLWIQASNLNAQFDQITPLVPMHFDPAGQPDRVEPISAIFSLPEIGLIVLIGNTLLGGVIYRRERLATCLLAGTAAVVQLLLWMAAIGIMRAVASS